MSKKHLYEYKGNGCDHCGKSISDVLKRYKTLNRMFEFHHINPELKASNYKNLIEQKLSTLQLKELDKCVLICTECHKIIHAQNEKVDLNIKLEIDNRIISKNISGWIITDHIEMTKKFISNDVHLLRPYLFKNDITERIVFSFEIIDDLNILFKEIKNLKDNSEFCIYSFNNGCEVLKAKRSGKRIELDISCLFREFSIDPNNLKRKDCFWVRGGFYLDYNGNIFNDVTFHIEADIDKLHLSDDM